MDITTVTIGGRTFRLMRADGDALRREASDLFARGVGMLEVGGTSILTSSGVPIFFQDETLEEQSHDEVPEHLAIIHFDFDFDA